MACVDYLSSRARGLYIGDSRMDKRNHKLNKWEGIKHLLRYLSFSAVMRTPKEGNQAL